MAKVAVLVPNQEMSTIAKSLTGEFPSISLMAIESIQTDQAVRRAGELEQQGCDLIVARGRAGPRHQAEQSSCRWWRSACPSRSWPVWYWNSRRSWGFPAPASG